MEPFLNPVSAILLRHPAPAMSLGELMSHLRADAPGVIPGRVALLRALDQDRERFTVVRAQSGQRSLGQVFGREDQATDQRAVEQGPWIICADALPAPPRSRAQGLVRRTLVHLGRGLDGQSARALARWLALLEESGRLGERLGALQGG